MVEKRPVPTVAIIISTYCGETYLKCQLDSILSQTDVLPYVYVRDDGSKDNTCQLLKEYASKNGIVVDYGINIGVGPSFMQTLYGVGENYDFYAFCDQDDTWCKDKLKSAIDALAVYDKPALYCSNQELTDANGVVTRLRHERPIDTSYLQTLNNNQITGCTMVWNKALQKLLCEKSRRPSNDLLSKRIHDVWVAMVAGVTGVIVYDEHSHILYRQHGNNVVGADGESLFSSWSKKLKSPKLRRGRSSLAREVLEKYGDVLRDSSIERSLHACAYYLNSPRLRWALMRDTVHARYSGESVLGFQIKVLLGLF